MKKIELLNQYYDAWVENEISSVINLLRQEKFGIRTFFEDLIFSIDDLENEFKKYKIISYEMKNMEEKDNVLYSKISLKYKYLNTDLDANIIVKAVFVDNKIVRLFETLEKPDFTRIKCIVSYDGSVFSGLQRQPDLRTVQGDIEKGLFFLTGEEITIHSSGRTDKGVHALNQVFHFDTLSKIKPNNFYRVVNSYLPDEIYMKSSEEVNKTFHSRYDVKSKEYMYVINYKEYNPIKRNYEWFIDDFDIDILEKELNSIVGFHDFTSFTKHVEDKEMVRKIIEVKLDKTESHLYISIVGKGFLRYMVRYLVATLIEIAKGNTNLSMIDFINLKNSSEVKWKAPSTGLYLKEVKYYE